MAIISGTGAADSLYSAAAGDILFGYAGADFLSLNHAGTVGHGGAGADSIWSTAGYVTAYGGPGDDSLVSFGIGAILHGGDGADSFVSNGPDAILRGDAGADHLLLGSNVGYTRMTGGDGADTFAFRYAYAGDGADVAHILDFDAAEGDRIEIDSIRDADGFEVGPDSFGDLTWTDYSDGSQIWTKADLGGGLEIRLDGYHAADLSASWFDFV